MNSPLRVMGKHKRRFLLRAFALCSLSGCALPVTPDDSGNQTPLLTALPRPLTSNEIKVRNAVNDFSFALFGTVSGAQKMENTFLSPLSAGLALGVTTNGAAGQTLAEMNATLRLSGMTQSEINGGFKSLTDLLVSLDPKVDVRIANSIWFRNTFPFHQPFFDSTTKYFGAAVRPLNAADPASSVQDINAWIRTATNNRIQSVINRVDPSDVMFLLNAIYFSGGWRDEFDLRNTTNAIFGALTGEQQNVALMVTSANLQYAETPEFQVVDLPYGNGAFSMTVLMPRASHDLNSIVSGMTTTTWNAIVASMRAVRVNLALPKLTMSYERTLNGDLRALGMNAAFTDGVADFSRMTPASVFITLVKQNTFVEINELGTHAAAATTVGIGVTSAPETKVMLVDGPYLFVIRERLSGTVMFMGRIVRMPG